MTEIVFLVLLTGHLLGDWVAQNDWEATNKTHSWAALGAHVATYHLIMGLLLLPILRDGWPASNALVVLTVSAATPRPHRPALAGAGAHARRRQPRIHHRRVGRDRRPGPAPVHPGHAGGPARIIPTAS
jgi:uncharacterized protein DUF3307